MNNLDKIYQKTGLNIAEFSKEYANYLSVPVQELEHEKIAKCIETLEMAPQSGNTIFLICKAGYSSTGSHIGNDFGLKLLKKSSLATNKSYRILAPTDNLSVTSTIGNVSTFDNVFLDYYKVHFREDDKFIGISASGNSPTLLVAEEWFKGECGSLMA